MADLYKTRMRERRSHQTDWKHMDKELRRLMTIDINKRHLKNCKESNYLLLSPSYRSVTSSYHCYQLLCCLTKLNWVSSQASVVQKLRWVTNDWMQENHTTSTKTTWPLCCPIPCRNSRTRRHLKRKQNQFDSKAGITARAIETLMGQYFD